MMPSPETGNTAPVQRHGVPGGRFARWWRRHGRSWTLLLAGLALLVYLVYYWAERIAIGKLQASGAQRLEVYVSSLHHALEKYDFLPKTLELNRDVIRMLQRPHDPELVASVNQYLEQMNAQARSTAIYISNLDGVTAAASNWRQNGSFIGDNISFRPYA